MSLQENNCNGTPRGAYLMFGIFMVLVYIGVGICCLCSVFEVILPQGVATALGCLFIVYGIWRGYRLFRRMK